MVTGEKGDYRRSPSDEYEGYGSEECKGASREGDIF
jgi:hypothetical protein